LITVGKSVQTVLLSGILFILFTLHLFTKWCATGPPYATWIRQFFYSGTKKERQSLCPG